MSKVLKTATFELRAAEVREPVERALHAYAAFVRAAVPGCAWTVFRDKAQLAKYVVMIAADDSDAEAARLAAAETRALEVELAPLLSAPIATMECELVTSTDLGRRMPTTGRGAAGARSRRSRHR